MRQPDAVVPQQRRAEDGGTAEAVVTSWRSEEAGVPCG
eukprot:gene21899-14031_t